MSGHEAAPQGLKRTDRITICKREAFGEKCVREHPRIARGLGGLDHALCGDDCLLTTTCEHQRVDQARPGYSMRVAAAVQICATPLDVPLGLTNYQIGPACQAL